MFLRLSWNSFLHACAIIIFTFCLRGAPICAATVTPTVSGPIGDPEKAGMELVRKLRAMAPMSVAAIKLKIDGMSHRSFSPNREDDAAV